MKGRYLKGGGGQIWEPTRRKDGILIHEVYTDRYSDRRTEKELKQSNDKMIKGLLFRPGLCDVPDLDFWVHAGFLSSHT